MFSGSLDPNMDSDLPFEAMQTRFGAVLWDAVATWFEEWVTTPIASL